MKPKTYKGNNFRDLKKCIVPHISVEGFMKI